MCKIAGIYFYRMLKVRKKTNSQLNIYPYNNLGVYSVIICITNILIMGLKLKIKYLFARVKNRVKNS